MLPYHKKVRFADETVELQISGDRMETILVFSVLLLACSISAAQTAEDEVILKKKIALLQPFTSDMEAVLTGIVASLAVQKEQITLLQKENQGTKLC